MNETRSHYSARNVLISALGSKQAVAVRVNVHIDLFSSSLERPLDCSCSVIYLPLALSVTLFGHVYARGEENVSRNGGDPKNPKL